MGIETVIAKQSVEDVVKGLLRSPAYCGIARNDLQLQEKYSDVNHHPMIFFC
jgi:hypothetical protein